MNNTEPITSATSSLETPSPLISPTNSGPKKKPIFKYFPRMRNSFQLKPKQQQQQPPPGCKMVPSRNSVSDSKHRQKEDDKKDTTNTKGNKKASSSSSSSKKSLPKQFIILCDVRRKRRRGNDDDDNGDGGDDKEEEEEEDEEDEQDDGDEEDDGEEEEEQEDWDEDEDDYDEESDSDSETEDEDASVSSVATDDLEDEDFTEDQKEEISKEITKDPYYKELVFKYKKTKDPKVKKLLGMYKTDLQKEKKKKIVKNQKTQDKYSRIFKRVLRQKRKNTNNDVDYFKEHYSKEQQYQLIKKAKELKKLTIQEKPHRITLLERDIPQIFKAHALKRVQTLRSMDPYDGEYYKIKNWVDTFMKIPFGNYVSLPVTITDGPERCNEFMDNACQILDQSVYGLNDAKMQIMQLLGQLISNPTSVGTAIAIHGDKGVGKTSIVKEGISKILNRPFAFIPLGGATDSSYLEGHSFTYEGSTWGKIVQILIDSKVMNPVIYFDELDKISETPKGEEIVSILTHLTDTTQNMEFHDKYFSDIHFDMSKCIFIFSYNDETKINPILRDRMYRIYAKGYDRKEKTIIARDYLLPKIRQEVNFLPDEIICSDEAIGHVIEKFGGTEAGVRNLKRYLEIIHTKLNLCRLMKPGTKMFDNNTVIQLSYPFHVTPEIINKLITQKDQETNPFMHMMYL